MKESIADQEWVWYDSTRAVIEALETPGAPVRFVGGCVRDGWLEKKVTDIDLATPLTPDQVCKKLTAAGMKPLTIGIEHGTISVFPVPKRRFEITTLRRDVATDGRHATVAFTDQWDVDARRRDFTINALYADPDGEIYDPLKGRLDLESRRVRFIGDPGLRIEEDFLRILRFFRFSAAYGRGYLDQDGLAACAEKKDGLSRLSGERVRDELLRILVLSRAVEVVDAMRETGVLAAVLPGGDSPEQGKIFAGLVRSPTITRGRLLRLAALIHDVDDVAGRLRLSRNMRRRLHNMTGQGREIFHGLSKSDAKKIIYRIGQQAFRDRARIAWAKDRIRATYWEDCDVNKAKWEDVLACARRKPPKFPVTGDMVCVGGIPEGPEVGRILKVVEDWWVENNFPKKADAVARLKAVIGEKGRK